MNTEIVSKKEEITNPVESYTLIWSDIAILIKWYPYYYGDYIAHLEITSENRLPLPITETGYRSHFIQREAVQYYG